MSDDHATTPITDEEVFASHEGGKLSVESTKPLDSKRALSIAYTPGVAQVSRAIHQDPTKHSSHTWASRLVVVLSDGSAVLGLGDIGPAASLPVMEGKSALFREFGGLNSIPLVIDTRNVDEVVETMVRLRPSFGAVNLEDVQAPRCFELEQKLIEALDCPVMHDDQHGTAVVVLAALINAARVTGRQFAETRVVIAGAGAAGIAVADILLEAGVEDIIVTDSQGTIHRDRDDLNTAKARVARQTNRDNVIGGVAEALEGADVFVGVSSAKVPEEAVARMADDAIVFALSNPDPEITPDVAARHATVVATGRSDFPNQINNVLAFPGIFRGALDAGARMITPAMKVAAATAIADVVGEDLAGDYIVPSPLDDRVAAGVAQAVMDAARNDAVTGQAERRTSSSLQAGGKAPKLAVFEWSYLRSQRQTSDAADELGARMARLPTASAAGGHPGVDEDQHGHHRGSGCEQTDGRKQQVIRGQQIPALILPGPQGAQRPEHHPGEDHHRGRVMVVQQPFQPFDDAHHPDQHPRAEHRDIAEVEIPRGGDARLIEPEGQQQEGTGETWQQKCRDRHRGRRQHYPPMRLHLAGRQRHQEEGRHRCSQRADPVPQRHRSPGGTPGHPQRHCNRHQNHAEEGCPGQLGVVLHPVTDELDGDQHPDRHGDHHRNDDLPLHQGHLLPKACAPIRAGDQCSSSRNQCRG